jgi:hypothetical protein
MTKMKLIFMTFHLINVEKFGAAKAPRFAVPKRSNLFLLTVASC